MLMLTKTRGLWHRQILQALATHGPLSTTQIYWLFPEHHEASVQPACKRLQTAGLVTRRYIVQNRCQAVEWSLTEAGYELLKTLNVTLGQTAAPPEAKIVNTKSKAEALEDDGWVPKPWVHPYRRQMVRHESYQQTPVHGQQAV